MKKSLLVVCAVMLVALAGLGFSTKPFSWAVGRALGKEARITGISGNWFTGYRFESLKGLRKGLEYEVANGRVGVGLGVLFGSTQLKSFDADKVSLLMTTGGARANPATGAPAGFGIGSVDVKDFSVWRMHPPGVRSAVFLGGELKVKDVGLLPGGPGFSDLEDHGPMADLKITSTNTGGAETTVSLTGTLKAAKESVFARDIPISGQFKHGKQGFEGTFSAFKDRLHLTMNKSFAVDLSVTDVTPSEELKVAVPFKKVNLAVHAEGHDIFGTVIGSFGAGPNGAPAPLGSELVAALAPSLKGDFVLGETKFDFVPVKPDQTEAPGAIAMAVGEHAGSKYSVYFKPLLGMVMPGMWTLHGTKQVGASPKETFANLYYGKPLARLSAAEKQTVTADSRMFWEGRAFGKFPSLLGSLLASKRDGAHPPKLGTGSGQLLAQTPTGYVPPSGLNLPPGFKGGFTSPPPPPARRPPPQRNQ